MRRNADLFVMLTTMNMVTLKHVYDEFGGTEWRSFVDFVACMLKHTEEYGSFIVDNHDPNARGRDRFFTYTANPELPQFTMLCQKAWQTATETNRAEVANRQRKEFKRTNAYSLNYLKNIKNREESQITQEQYLNRTDEADRARDVDMFQVLLRGHR